MDLHDVVVIDMDLNLYVAAEILKDTYVATDVDFDVPSVDSFTIILVEDLYALDVSTIMDLMSHDVSDRVCDLDIVVDLVFMYKDAIMDDRDDKLQRLLVEHYDF